MRSKAIQALDSWIINQTPKEAVLLAKKYCIANWLKHSYTRLLRQQTLTANELNTSPSSLDWETIARLLSAREAIRVTSSTSPSTGSCSCDCCNRNNGNYYSHDRCRGCQQTCYQTNVYSPTDTDLETAIQNEFGEEIARIDEHHP